MQHTEIYNQIIALKKREMEIRFTPINSRDKSFISEVRKIKADMAKLLIQLDQLKRKKI